MIHDANDREDIETSNDRGVFDHSCLLGGL